MTNKKIKNATPNVYKGIKFRSKLEITFAKLLDENNIPYKYEFITIPLLNKFKYKGKTIRSISYTPDFFINPNVLVEIKGYCNDVWPIKRKLLLNNIVNSNYNFVFYEAHNKQDMINIINTLKQ